MSFFNQNPEVIAIGVDRAKICAFFYVLLGFSHVVSSLLRGLGRPVMPMVVMLVCWCAVRVVVLMTIGQSVHSLYLTHWLYPITWGLSSIVYLLDNNLLLVDLIFWIDLLRILCWLIDL
ncbi:MATE family efflux transporter [Holdemanella porci]|uniref:MATE family efflux transporter n=1 Tax=Holdemanella porci TaxID=2652276 RepID=UPI003AB51587